MHFFLLCTLVKNLKARKRVVCVCSKVIPGDLAKPDDHAWIGDSTGVRDGREVDAGLVSLGAISGELDLEAATGEDVEEVELARAGGAQVGAVGLVGKTDHAIDEDLPEARDVVTAEGSRARDPCRGQGVMSAPTFGCLWVKMTILNEL